MIFSCDFCGLPSKGHRLKRCAQQRPVKPARWSDLELMAGIHVTSVTLPEFTGRDHGWTRPWTRAVCTELKGATRGNTCSYTRCSQHCNESDGSGLLRSWIWYLFISNQAVSVVGSRGPININKLQRHLQPLLRSAPRKLPNSVK